jgi:hypothetical protein
MIEQYMSAPSLSQNDFSCGSSRFGPAKHPSRFFDYVFLIIVSPYLQDSFFFAYICLDIGQRLLV